MSYLQWAVLVVGGLCLLHRIALWAEARGWIYYRKQRGGSGSLGNAFLEVQTILEPSKRHILEERVKKAPATQESGDQPNAGIGPTKASS
jgi:hypothetical protein